MAGNSNLHMSQSSKQDEFYTQLSTIEDELRHYRAYFRDKIVFCNCDDPAISEDGQNHYGDGLGGYASNFFRFFQLNFHQLGLKKLITTHYEPNKPSYKFEIVCNNVGDQLGLPEYVKTPLSGNGDFRSVECQELLREADIVVTNPPFSLMSEYLPMLIESGKQFLILGNMNHALYTEIFRYIFEKKVWLGYNSGHFWFMVPDYYEPKKTDYKEDCNGQKWRRMGNICWFTNMDVKKRHERLDLYKEYSPEKYPSLDNYDAIFCREYSLIPYDTDKIIRVPLTYLAHHCDEQFEILGKLDGGSPNNPLDLAKPIINGKVQYKGLAIRHRTPGKDGNNSGY